MSEKERPILLTGAMVRAILEGRKTQTRRVVRPMPENASALWPDDDSHIEWANVIEKPEYYTACGWCPYGKTGDRLWVRETFEQVHPCQISEGRFSLDGQAGIPGPPSVTYRVIYGADGEYPRKHFIQEYPYRAACIGTACQKRHLHPEESWQGWTPSIHMPRWASRLTLEITGVRVERAQDISEADAIAEGVLLAKNGLSPQESFIQLWDSINETQASGKYAWIKNPWVWVVDFKPLEAN